MNGYHATDRLIRWLSGEWLLTRCGIPNGGGVIFLRASLITILVFAIALAAENGVDPTRNCVFSLFELRDQVAKGIPAAGTIFAAVYAALYARFASQWSYLAELYNQIKETEVGMHAQGGNSNPDTRRALNDWRAGFIEDAEDLHLAAKPAYAATILAWVSDPGVSEAFRKNTFGGTRRLAQLKERLGRVRENR